MASARGRGLWALPVSMFIGTFAWSFIQVSLPFYIGKISTLDAAATLRWTGWILGISSLVTMVMAPFSARIFGEKNPKRSYVATQMLQGGGFFFMAPPARSSISSSRGCSWASWAPSPPSPSSWWDGAVEISGAAYPPSSRA